MILLSSSISRSAILRAFTAALGITAPIQQPQQALAVRSGSTNSPATVGASRNPVRLVMLLSRCGGALCTEYIVDGQSFRAVVDTGSPFLLVYGSCNGRTSRFGCYDSSLAGEQGSLNEASKVEYGGQDVGVEWRRGTVRFPSLSANDRFMSKFSSSSTGELVYEPLTFGVVRSYTAKGGSTAVYLGLVKNRASRIRSTLLEQTDVSALRFQLGTPTTPPPAAASAPVVASTSFSGPANAGSSRSSAVDGRTLTLSSRPLVPKGSDAIPIVDLRPLGAPITPYAAKVHRMIVNGRAVDFSRPCVAVMDTGTTGLSISDTLYDSDELPMPGAAMRDIELQFLTERGQVVSLTASSRRRPPTSSKDEFPLVVTPVELPWFEPENVLMAQNDILDNNKQISSSKGDGATKIAGGHDSRRSVRAQDNLRSTVTSTESSEIHAGSDGGPGIGDAPHVLFLGLAFLVPQTLTIDIDSKRMTITGPTPLKPKAVSKSEPLVHEGWNWKRMKTDL